MSNDLNLRHHAASRRYSFAIRAGAALFWAAVATAGCDRTPDRPMPKETARNVILVLIDTLRADKLGCYGNTLGLTPNLDRLATGGYRFDQAFSHAPWTLPATASLLTSAYPQQHGAGVKKGGRSLEFNGLAEGVRTIAQCYYDQGYDTAAIANVFFLAPQYGLDRGFSVYDFVAPDRTQRIHRRATEVTDWTLAWVKRHRESSNRPFFLLVHYFDPHLAYDPPERFRKKFALPEDQTPDPTLFGSRGDMIDFRGGRIKPADLPIKRLEALYNGEVAYTDEQVGRLVDELGRMGLSDKTILVITADHGEEFFDHGGFEHGHSLYDEMIRVPLIFWAPGLIQTGETRKSVGHVDIAPTLCSLSKIEPEPKFVGKSLERHLFGENRPDESVFSQGNMWGPDLTAIRVKGRHKFIERPPGRELYDIVEDPREKRNLVRESQFATLADELEKVLASFKKLLGERLGTSVKLSKDEIDRLRGGGYWVDIDESGAMDENDSGPTDHPTASAPAPGP